MQVGVDVGVVEGIDDRDRLTGASGGRGEAVRRRQVARREAAGWADGAAALGPGPDDEPLRVVLGRLRGGDVHPDDRVAGRRAAAGRLGAGLLADGVADGAPAGATATAGRDVPAAADTVVAAVALAAVSAAGHRGGRRRHRQPVTGS